MTTVSTQELITEMLRLSTKLDDGVQALYKHAQEYAIAEDDYRAGKARVYLSLDGGTVDYRKAYVDNECRVLRRDRNHAEAMKLAALEAVRSRRAQLSALQSVAASWRTELELSKYGPDGST